MEQYNKFQIDTDDLNTNNVKLHYDYDYKSYKNILNSSLTKELDLLSQKDDMNNKLANPPLSNNIINSNLNT